MSLSKLIGWCQKLTQGYLLVRTLLPLSDQNLLPIRPILVGHKGGKEEVMAHPWKRLWRDVVSDGPPHSVFQTNTRLRDLPRQTRDPYSQQT